MIQFDNDPTDKYNTVTKESEKEVSLTELIQINKYPVSEVLSPILKDKTTSGN